MPDVEFKLPEFILQNACVRHSRRRQHGADHLTMIDATMAQHTACHDAVTQSKREDNRARARYSKCRLPVPCSFRSVHVGIQLHPPSGRGDQSNTPTPENVGSAHRVLKEVSVSNCHSVQPVNAPDVFKLCRTNKWHQVHSCVRQNPWIAETPLTMDNNISTTILHQAISSKSDTQARAAVIETILELAPKAASMRNGYGSLPLHVITQRNTKMDSKTKERLISGLIHAYPNALVEAGGVGGRTPLHIVFTDYISAEIVRTMITMAPKACFMRDKKGWLPIHMACSRHCSPEKLRMLLEANPASLHAKTPEGESLLCIAKSRATKSHPNYALIGELKEQLKNWKGDEFSDEQAASVRSGNPPTSASSVVTPETLRFHRTVVHPGAPVPSSSVDASAHLLLHFHRTNNLKDDQAEASDENYAEV